MTVSKLLKYTFVCAMGFGGISAHAGPDSYIGDVTISAASYCPRDTMEARGQLLAISEYTALFSLYGTFYGGDGRTTFGLPDLRGRAPVHFGTGPGLSTYAMGQKAGIETNTLTVANLPPHNHLVKATTGAANTKLPDGAHLAGAPAPARAAINSTIDTSKTFSPSMLGTAGSPNPAPINNVQPVLAMRYCVTVEGPYPPRS